MRFKLDTGFLTSLILLPKTALHSLILPVGILRRAVSLGVDEWNEEYVPIGFLLALYLYLGTLGLAPGYGMPPGFEGASLGEKFAMLPQYIAPILFTASIFIGCLLFVSVLIFLLFSFRKINKTNIQLAIRFCLLIPLPLLTLRLLRVHEWIPIPAISDPEARTELEQLFADGLQAGDLLRAIEVASVHWQFWLALWPYLLCLLLFLFYCGYFVISGWAERRQRSRNYS